MRLYHFTTARYGLDNIDRRRLKIATIPDLNDPFELLCVDLTDKNLRKSMHGWKKRIGLTTGMLCFSENWANPVQWSHYTDKHKGLCLGFDVTEKSIFPVLYDKLRSKDEAEQMLKCGKSSEAQIKKFLSTKFAHWAYEQEHRVFVDLIDIDPVTKLHFCDFSDDMRLVEVIVGAHSDVERAQIKAVLRELDGKVEVTNARLGFKHFEVVMQKDENLWK